MVCPWHSLGRNTFPSPGDLPDPAVELESPALQADSLQSESPGKSIYLTTRTHLHIDVHTIGASYLAQWVENLPAIQETWVRFPESGIFPGGGHGNPL